MKVKGFRLVLKTEAFLFEQSRKHIYFSFWKKFFSKFFMIVDYYHKTCCYIQEINNNYPKVFTNTLIMFLNLGENIIYILNILLQTYIKDIKSIEFINFCKEKIYESINSIKN